MGPLALLYMIRDMQEAQRPKGDVMDPLLYERSMTGPSRPSAPRMNYRDPEQAGPAPPAMDRLASMYRGK